MRASSNLVGRDVELQLIRELLANARRRPSVLFLTGEPGVGKTALLDAGADIAFARGMRVLRADGFEAEADVTYAALNQLLLPLLAELPRLSEQHRVALEVALGIGSGPAPARDAVSDATIALLGSVELSLLTIDDAQWLDRGSAEVIRRVTEAADTAGTAVLAAARSFDAIAVGDNERLEVMPLASDAAAALVSSRFPELDDRARRTVIDEARGNPLALLELPFASPRNSVPGSNGQVVVGTLASQVTSVFGQRIDALPKAAQELLLLAALDAGGLLRFSGPRRSLQQPDVLNRLVKDGLVTIDTRGRLMLRHSLVRAAVIRRSTESDRRSAHHQLAELAKDRPEHRAWHVGQATHEPDETIASLLESSARRSLRKGDVARAVTTMVRSSELSVNPEDRGRRLAAAAYLGASAAGDVSDAQRLLSEAVRINPELNNSLEVAATAAHVLIEGDGDVATVQRLLLSAIDASRGRNDIDPDSLSQAGYVLIRTAMVGARPEFAANARDALLGCGHPLPPELELLCMFIGGQIDLDHPLLAAHIGLVEANNRVPDPVRTVKLGMTCSLRDKLRHCLPALEQARLVTRDEGATPAWANICGQLALESYYVGDWIRAGELATEVTSGENPLPYWTFAAHYVRLMLTSATSPDELDASGRALMRWAAPRGMTGLIWILAHARAQAALSRSEYEDAFAHLSSIGPVFAPGVAVLLARLITFDLAEAAIRVGRPEVIAEHLEALRATHFDQLSERVAFKVAGAEAIASGPEDYVEKFEQALAIAAPAECPFDCARLQLAYGERLRRQRASVEARGHLEAARQVFERLGAPAWAERAASELRASSVSKVRIARDAQEPLTLREIEIARLAAAGLTNKQIAERLFVSPRTVGAHLRRLFPKLGVTSRAALRDALDAAANDDGTVIPVADAGELLAPEPLYVDAH